DRVHIISWGIANSRGRGTIPPISIYAGFILLVSLARFGIIFWVAVVVSGANKDRVAGGIHNRVAPPYAATTVTHRNGIRFPFDRAGGGFDRDDPASSLAALEPRYKSCQAFLVRGDPRIHNATDHRR